MKTCRLAILALLVAVPAFAQGPTLTVTAPETLSERRISRTVFEYVMRAAVLNSGTATAKGVTATCTSTSPRTTVVEGTLTIGNVAAQGSTASTDTITIAHDRTVPFDPAVLQWTITKVPTAPAVAAPASPSPATSATLTGTAEAGVTVEIVGGTSTVTGTASDTGAFSIAVPLQLNRINKLFVTALKPAGRSEPVPADLIQDGQAPSLYIDFPQDGATLTNDAIVVAGRVGDMLSGFMGLSVTLNSQPSTTNSFVANVNVGIGQNGTFERGGVPLALGGKHDHCHGHGREWQLGEQADHRHARGHHRPAHDPHLRRRPDRARPRKAGRSHRRAHHQSRRHRLPRQSRHLRCHPQRWPALRHRAVWRPKSPPAPGHH